MPTGYTAPIEDQEGFTFEEYAWRCARGMMPLFSLRDHGLDAPIPERIEIDPGYAERVAEARARLRRTEAMTDAEALAEIDRQHEQAVKARTEYAAANSVETARYQAMLARVADWTPPTPDHEALKKFMASQIHASMPDGGGWPDPVKPTLAIWREVEMDYARRALARREEDLAAHLKRVEFNNAWLAALRESVGPPPSRATVSP